MTLRSESSNFPFLVEPGDSLLTAKESRPPSGFSLPIRWMVVHSTDSHTQNAWNSVTTVPDVSATRLYNSQYTKSNTRMCASGVSGFAGFGGVLPITCNASGEDYRNHEDNSHAGRCGHLLRNFEDSPGELEARIEFLFSVEFEIAHSLAPHPFGTPAVSSGLTSTCERSTS